MCTNYVKTQLSGKDCNVGEGEKEDKRMTCGKVDRLTMVIVCTMGRCGGPG